MSPSPRRLRRLLWPLLLLAACAGGNGPAADLPPRTDQSGTPELLSDAAVPTDLPELLVPDTAADASLPDLPDAAAVDLPPETTLADLADASVADLADGETVEQVQLPDVEAETEVTPPPELAAIWPLGEVVAECEGGLLAQTDSPSGTVRFLVLRGSHYAMGRQAGCLVGKETGQFFGQLMGYFAAEVQKAAADIGLDPEQTSELLFSMLNNIWLHVEPYVPASFVEELQGFEDAVLADPEIAAQWTGTKPDWALRAFVLLSNLSDLNWGGSLEDVLAKLSVGASPELLAWFAEDEVALLLRHTLRPFLDRPGPLPLRTSCSFFAAWGPRSADGHLLASRNLDWSTDTGIGAVKGITFYAPTGGRRHATIGYLGFLGALAGMSEAGIVLSEVGSESVMERLWGEPWTLKFREILERAEGLDDAVAMAAGISADGTLRPPTIGYNWMIGFGDPEQGGAGAAAAALESNGLVAGILRGTPECQQETQLVHYGEDGVPGEILDHLSDPLAANQEKDAVEVDSEGNPKLFQVDGEGAFVLDGSGYPVLSQDGTGKPYPVGRALACALFRGDEALVHGVRRWQTASNGPQGGADKLLCKAGSYRHRYLVMHDMLEAYEKGAAYEKDGVSWIEETGETVPVGLPQAEQIARAAAMGSNVMSIAYDATALRLRVSWEIGTGESWQAAHKHDYIELDLGAAFAALAQAAEAKEVP
jgi:hypothetical protein